MAAGRSRLSGLAALVFAGVILTGCAQTADLSTDAATSLQGSVRHVAEQAASRDYSGALASLDSLQSQLAGDITAGLVSRDRGARIQGAIDRVRADLAPRTTPSATPAPSPTPTGDKVTGKDKHGKDGKGG